LKSDLGYASLTELNEAAIKCELCPRLRKYCQRIAKEKRRQFQDWTYSGKPLPGFGDPKARLLILGLAPAAQWW
jgi:uracil-DNA glycosylase